MQPLLNYSLKNKLPPSNSDAHKVHLSAKRYLIINDRLYCKSVAEPYLRCLLPRHSEGVKKDIHEEMTKTLQGLFSSQQKDFINFNSCRTFITMPLNLSKDANNANDLQTSSTNQYMSWQPSQHHGHSINKFQTSWVHFHSPSKRLNLLFWQQTT